MNIQMHRLYKKQNKSKTEQQTKWNDIQNSITSTAKVTNGYLNWVHNAKNICCDEIAILLQQQKHLRQKVSNCKEVEKINNMKTERNKILD